MLLYFIYYTVTKCYFSKCQTGKKRQKSISEEVSFQNKRENIFKIKIIQNLFKVTKLSIGFVIASVI